MEEEVRPKVILTINNLCKNYLKLSKFQNEKLDSALNAKEFSPAKEKSYKKIRDSIVEKIGTLQLNATVLENLVQLHYQENKKILFNYYESVFPWLRECEKIFGFEDLRSYGLKRIYGFLAERYMSFWFKKYTKYKVLPIYHKDLSRFL